MKGYNALRAAYVKDQLSSAYKQGWDDLSSYYASDLRKSYSNREFPVRFASKQLDNAKRTTFNFDVYNKTALPMTVYADKKGESTIGSPYFASIDLQPMSRQTLTIRAPEPTTDTPRPEILFSIKVGDEFLHGITYVPVSN